MMTPISKLNALARRFRRARRGATAIEFAILVPPVIFASLFAIDLGNTYMVASSLDAASATLTEEIRAGRAGSISEGNFCERVKLSYCDFSKLGVNVEQLRPFGHSSDPTPGTFSINLPAGGGPTMATLTYSISKVAPAIDREDLIIRAGGFTSAQ